MKHFHLVELLSSRSNSMTGDWCQGLEPTPRTPSTLLRTPFQPWDHQHQQHPNDAAAWGVSSSPQPCQTCPAMALHPGPVVVPQAWSWSCPAPAQPAWGEPPQPQALLALWQWALLHHPPITKPTQHSPIPTANESQHHEHLPWGDESGNTALLHEHTPSYTHKLSIHCIRCLRHYTAWSVEGSLLKSVGTEFKYFPHWCLNSLLPRDCSLSLDHTIQACPVPLDLIRLLLLGEEKGSPCFLPEEEGGRAVPTALHAPHTKQFHDCSMFSEDTQGMEKLGPALLCLKATSSCPAVPKSLFYLLLKLQLLTKTLSGNWCKVQKKPALMGNLSSTMTIY